MQNFNEKTAFFEENERFSKVIRNLAKRLNDTQAEGELWGFLWLLKNRPKPPPNEFYILACLKREYIRLSKIEKAIIQCEIIISVDNWRNIDFNIDFKSAFAELTPKQKEIFALRISGFSASEIAKMRGISRQSVHETYTKACLILRKKISRA